jgi:Domain of unknown function (DUF6766)
MTATRGTNRTADHRTPVGRWFYEHALAIVCFAIFLACFAGMAASGFQVHNAEQVAHGSEPSTFGDYLTSGDFAEATFENWESEFLQMGSYVVLTIFLFQKGSSESKPIGERTPQDEDPREAKHGPDTPWPVRRGGLALVLYENSLAILFFVLFGLSFWLHAVSGADAYSAERLQHGQPGVTTVEYLGTAQFWFESMQNWQSEFLAVAALVAASVFLRQRGSPESKPVATPHHETGA